MTSRERILKCIRHEPIDRVPVSTYELVGWNAEAWENKEPSYRELMDAVREFTDCIYMADGPQIAKPQPWVETVESRQGSSLFVKRICHTPKGDLAALYRQDDGVHTVWTLEHLLKGVGDIDAYLSMPHEPAQIDMSRFYADQQALGDKGVMMLSVGDPICLAAELFEMGTFLTLALEEPERIKYLLDAIHERQMQSLKDILRHDVTGVLFRICGPEYATPPYLPPRCFNEFVTGYLIDIVREINQAGGIARIHSHGKIGKVIDQFAMTQAQGLDPIEPPPDGDIGLSEVKRLVGDRFCLFGNIELRELECAGTERIDRLVKEAMDAAKAGSGFILMPTAAPINVPLSAKTRDNYLQMIESASKYGKY